MKFSSAPDADATAVNAVLVASRQSVDAICDRWSLTLVLAMLQGERRFGGLLARTGMAARLLTDRLRLLERLGVILRQAYSLRPPRDDYCLSAMGEGLLEIILQMAAWDQAWGKAGPAMVHEPCGNPMRPTLNCQACGAAAGARDIDLRLSPAQLRRMPAKQTARRRSTHSTASYRSALGGLGQSLDVFGDKWGIEILICAFFRIRRFSEFRRHTGIAPNILSDRLERMTEMGVLVRDDGSTHAGFRLTDKGRDLYGVIVSVQSWADAWLPERYRSPVQLIHRDCGAKFKPMTCCAACGRPAKIGEVQFMSGREPPMLSRRRP